MARVSHTGNCYSGHFISVGAQDTGWRQRRGSLWRAFPSLSHPAAQVLPRSSESRHWRGPAGGLLWGLGAAAPPAPASSDGRDTAVPDLQRCRWPK